jgi:two-component system OmpR family response regulator
VLLVEDHAAVAEATAEFLRLHGLDVRIAASGFEALKMVEEFHPVLVLCDISLPDMTGLDVARALRARGGAADLLLAMLTAMHAADLGELERETNIHGVDLYLSKPLTSEALTDLLSRLDVLQRRARRDPVRSP